MWPRWLRFAASAWVALDSRKRKGTDWMWLLLVFIMGPLMLPFYLAARPLKNNEKRVGGFFWNSFLGFEKFLTWVTTLAVGAVLYENMRIEKTPDIANVKIAEIKAGSLLGAMVVAILLLIEKAVFYSYKNKHEKKYIQ